MTRLNWEKAAEQERYRQTKREVIDRTYKEQKITNAQKKLISKMVKERGIAWDNTINSLSSAEASAFIAELKQHH